MVLEKQNLMISLRNVFRNKRRTFITLFILILSSTGLVIVGGFFNGLFSLLKEGYIRGGTGHLQINKMDYSEYGGTAPFEYLLENFTQLKTHLKRNPRIKEISPILKFGGMLTTEDTSVPVIAVSHDPVVAERLDESVFERNRKNPEQGYVKILEGENLDKKDPDGIIIGKDLKKALGLEVGDPVYFITTQRLGAIEGAQFYIKGIYRSAIKALGERVIKMNLETAQKLWAIPDQVHSINVYLNKTEDTNAVKTQILATPEIKAWDIEVIPWYQQSELYNQTKVFLQTIYRFLQIIISIIIFFSIANTINMNLLERIKEYGTMMAIGCNRSLVASVILFEAGMLGAFGGILGGGFAIVAAKLINALYIIIPPPPLATSGVGIPLFISLGPQLIFETFVICFLATLLSSIIPAYRATHLRIVQALGYA